MLRAFAVLIFLCGPAMAWEMKPGAICELVHDETAASVRVTYDPSIPEYAIAITPARGWTSGPFFAMRFDGPRQNTIATNRHVLSQDNATLTVTDRGFGNVLDGLEFNQTATALLGDQQVAISLNNAAPAVQEFRACAAGVGV